jgi:hypothetical protein
MLKINTLVWKLASFSYIFAASKVIIKPMFHPSPKERSRIKVAPLIIQRNITLKSVKAKNQWFRLSRKPSKSRF